MDKLNEALNVLIEILKSTKDFVSDQAPHVAQEIVSYAFWSNAMGVSFWVVMILAAIWSAYIICKKLIPKGDEEAVLFLFVPLLIGSVSAYFLVNNIDIMVKAKVAPRVVILDYLESKLSKK